MPQGSRRRVISSPLAVILTFFRGVAPAAISLARRARTSSVIKAMCKVNGSSL